MFENPGQKLKKLAKIVFWIIFASSFLGFIIYLGSVRRPGFLDFIVCVLILGGGILVGFLSNLGLYAFGELVENSGRMVKLLEKAQLGESGSAKPAAAAETTAAAPVTAPAPAAAPVSKPVNHSAQSHADKWICPNCGKEHRDYELSCSCGAVRSKGNFKSSAPADNHSTQSSADKWICSNCGKEHYDYELSCSCGALRTRAKRP